MNWALEYIGMKPGNCWTFVRKVYQEQLGIELPEFAYIMIEDIPNIVRTMETEKSKHWEKIDTPIDFAAVAMSKSEAIHHVGIYTEQDGGRIVHSYEGDPVIANDHLQLKRMGFKRVEYYVLSSDSNFQPV